jgi:DNA-binding CsgD family transcriptional regulator
MPPRPNRRDATAARHDSTTTHDVSSSNTLDALARSVAAAVQEHLHALNASSPHHHVAALLGESELEASRLRLASCHVVGAARTPADSTPIVVAIVLVPDRNADDLAGSLIRQFGLTRRESDVAALLLRHASTAHIARELGVTSHTARHHVERVLAKLEVRTRADAVAVISRLRAREHAVETGIPVIPRK